MVLLYLRFDWYNEYFLDAKVFIDWSFTVSSQKWHLKLTKQIIHCYNLHLSLIYVSEKYHNDTPYLNYHIDKTITFIAS
jgi:hypothetical protein